MRDSVCWLDLCGAVAFLVAAIAAAHWLAGAWGLP